MAVRHMRSRPASSRCTSGRMKYDGPILISGSSMSELRASCRSAT